MKTTLLFDFDGTLINTNHLIQEGLDTFAFVHRGYPLTPDEHQGLTGKPLEIQMKYISPTRWQMLCEDFQLWYKGHHDQLAKPFDGIAELLGYLEHKGYRLAIVSNNSRPVIDRGLRLLGLDRYFQTIIAHDDVAERKPSPEGLHKAMALMGASTEETIFVGDSSSDLLAGKNAGITTVLVGWTSQNLTELRKLEPSFVIQYPLDLAELLLMLQIMSA